MALANMLNRLGDSVDAIVYAWIAYEITQSAALMALMMGINQLPTIFLQPITGAMVDRMSKKKVMIWCDICRGLVVMAVAVAYLAGAATTGLLIASTVINSTLEAFRVPAGLAINPMLLSKDKYALGSGLNQSVSRVCEMIGLALAGVAIGLIGSGGVLIIDAAFFFSSAFVIALIKLKETLVKKGLHLQHIWQDLVEGAQYIAGKQLMKALILLGMVINLSMVPVASFVTVFVKDTLQGGSELLSAFELARIAGMGLGAFIAPKLKKFSNQTWTVLGGSLMAFATMALWLIAKQAPSPLRIALVLLAAVIMGLGTGVMSVIFSTALMKHTDEEYLGRMGGICNAVMSAAIPLGSFICSALATVTTVPIIFLGAGVFALVIYLVLGKTKIYQQL